MSSAHGHSSWTIGLAAGAVIWLRKGLWPRSIVVREVFSLAGRPSIEHIYQD